MNLLHIEHTQKQNKTHCVHLVSCFVFCAYLTILNAHLKYVFVQCALFKSIGSIFLLNVHSYY